MVAWGLRGRRRRKGAATVETALCLPLMVILTCGSVEACSMIFLQQALAAASYEGVRTGTRKTTAEATASASTVLTARNVRSPTVTCSPADFTTATPGTRLTVSVAAPCSSNGILPAWFYAGRQVSASATMVRN